MPIGTNSDGEWVNINNNCTKCGHSMSLPNMNNKYCPSCGTYCHVPSERERAVSAEQTRKRCPKCSYSNGKNADFCIECGAKL